MDILNPFQKIFNKINFPILKTRNKKFLKKLKKVNQIGNLNLLKTTKKI